MKIIKFGAIWCNGCIVMRPRWEEIQKELPWLKTEYYDYDENKDMVNKYKVTDVIPVAIFIDKDGNEIERFEGEVSKERLTEAIETNKEK